MSATAAVTVMAAGIVAGSAAPAAAQWRDRQPRDGICLYKDADFRGQRVCLEAGEAADRLPWGLDDEVSSIRVFGRAEYTLFRDRDFRGKSAHFERDVLDLDRYDGWNDKVSSIQVQGRRYGGGYGSGGNGYGYGDPRRDPDRIVRRAYQDVLEREPDAAGLRLYRGRILQDGWSEDQVRDALRRSPEYRDQHTMTWPKAEEVVRRAYQTVLRREPDPGSRTYVDKVFRDKWTQADVERELRRSDEYRNRR
jgi:hypothetical protein